MGAWGKDYNVLVVHLTSNTLRRVDIKNWNSFISCVPNNWGQSKVKSAFFSSEDMKHSRVLK
jgi:hypothetical protein